MKTKLSILFLLLALQGVNAQNYQTVEDINDACAALGFSGNDEAEITVDRILEQIGLTRNFILQECPEINNAVAINIEVGSGKKERFILYDNSFFNRINDKANNDWAAISVLAHEIGHHLNGHALNNKGSNHKWELEADYSSGFYLAKMGATLEEAQSAIKTLKYEKATSTHPAKIDRLNEIEKGWRKGMENRPKVEEDIIIMELEKGEECFLKGGTAFNRGKYQEAMEWYLKAVDENYVEANYSIAEMYLWGKGVKQNFKKSYSWHRKAARLGYEPSQRYLKRQMKKW